ncbi:hypothetical protein FNV43_RR17768 [Rhamnella rubrinervis]|uniref:YABBY2 n=1 Tax=Rhamnella rubrinervis TaxID=2594499 RepID=A0A8K0DY63_9ROSA|nr:hypothetical protein FNV43_RR17768 [Rhamnella rubrinervis]
MLAMAFNGFRSSQVAFVSPTFLCLSALSLSLWATFFYLLSSSLRGCQAQKPAERFTERNIIIGKKGRDYCLYINGNSPYSYYPCEVSVPCSSFFTIVTVRCGHCANLLSVNMGATLQTLPAQDPQKQIQGTDDSSNKECGSSSKCNKLTPLESVEQEQPRLPPIRPPEKRQRVPSAYNRFIKEEIQRIKAGNPDISHREAFSTAAKM